MPGVQNRRFRSDLFNRLKRVTNNKRYIAEIDGIRFFAIITVVFLHLGTHLRRELGDNFFASLHNDPAYQISIKGGLGVSVFFALSGFILALPFAQFHFFNASRIKLKDYYYRRVTRLEPPYVISLILFFIAIIWVAGGGFFDLLPNFIASLFYAHYIIYGEWSVINPVAWSLETEVQFYLIAPFISFLFAIKKVFWRRLIIVLLIVFTIILNDYFHHFLREYHLNKSVVAYIHLFLTGYLFADIYLLELNKKINSKTIFWDLIGILSIISLFYFYYHKHPQSELFFVSGLFLFFIATFRGGYLNKILKFKVFSVIGGMCYTIYLLHYPLIAFTMQFTHRLAVTSSFWVNLLIQSVLIIPVILVVSAIFFVLIERPCMEKEWPKKSKKFISDKTSSILKILKA